MYKQKKCATCGGWGWVDTGLPTYPHTVCTACEGAGLVDVEE